MIIYWAGQFRAPVSVDDIRNRSIIDCEYCQEVQTACRGTVSFLDQVRLYIAGGHEPQRYRTTLCNSSARFTGNKLGSTLLFFIRGTRCVVLIRFLRVRRVPPWNQGFSPEFIGTEFVHIERRPTALLISTLPARSR